MKQTERALPGAAQWVRIALPVTLALLCALQLHPQLLHPAGGPPPSFEVATIRPSDSESAGPNFRISTASFKVENAPLTELIRFAYNIKSDDQLLKGPGWTGRERFDIDAKIADAQVEAMKRLPPEQKFEQYRWMMQALLGDRFMLKVSTQKKELPVYALVIAKNGPKLTKLSLDPQIQRMPTLYGGSRGDLHAGSVSMAFFTGWLSGSPNTGGRVVIDATGLQGSFDFELKWTPDELHSGSLNGAGSAQGPSNSPLPDASAPSFLTALEEQLGLKLESRKAFVEVLAIDHVERPSPN